MVGGAAVWLMPANLAGRQGDLPERRLVRGGEYRRGPVVLRAGVGDRLGSSVMTTGTALRHTRIGDPVLL